MRNAMRGRNLAHVGCMFGIVLGLTGGLVLAWNLILQSVASAIALLLWAIITVVLGAVGFFVGTAATQRDVTPPASES